MSGLKSYEEFDAWRLSAELRDRVLKLVAIGRAANDRKFCEQIRDAVRSPPRNIAEGYGRFKPRQFAQFVRVAHGSLKETRNHLLDGVTAGYFKRADIQPMLTLQRRALAACTGLLKYLDSCKGRAPTGWDVADAEVPTLSQNRRRTLNLNLEP